MTHLPLALILLASTALALCAVVPVAPFIAGYVAGEMAWRWVGKVRHRAEWRRRLAEGVRN